MFTLFDKYSWHLDDRSGGKPDEINPDVLGYIFEKYINQKAFGAYYTRPEITEYLCDRTINKLILDRVNGAMAQQPRDPREIQAFESIEDMATHMDAAICRHLVMGDDAILRNLSLLDPACGSGAFLIAAMKTLIKIYSSIIGTVTTSTDHQLRHWLKQVTDDHPSVSYFIKKRIITDNLYGVDIMEEAVEIAKLRLFLALVSSAMTVEELEPLPNIDFNIMAGNSLIGLLRVDENAFNQLVPSKGTSTDPTQINLMGETVVQGSLLGLEAANRYREILEEKNRSIAMYKTHAFSKDDGSGTEQDIRLLNLRQHIDQVNHESETKLNQILLMEFVQKLRIRYEQAQLKGRPKKRDLTIADIEALKPFHWGYHFDRVMARGGFDAIIANPPWEVFQTDEKEFFQQHDSLIRKNKIDIKSWGKQKKKLLEDPEIAQYWLDYCSGYPHVSAFFKKSNNYKNQISRVNGKIVSGKINLYAVFLDQCFNLLRGNGEFGIVIPSGIYTDLGTKQLREMLFSQSQVTGLFCLENKREVFENVHRSFKIVVLTYEKSGKTRAFPAAFMRQNVQEIQNFPNTDSIEIDVSLIRKLSPDALSIIEFKDNLGIKIAAKMSEFPLLGEKIANRWRLRLCNEFNMTNDSHLFYQENKEGRLPLYEGKMIHQFNSDYASPKYWLDESEAREKLIQGRIRRIKKIGKDKGGLCENIDIDESRIVLYYESYRFAFRDVARTTDERTCIMSVLPKGRFCPHTMSLERVYTDDFNENKYEVEYNIPILNFKTRLYIVGIFNSFIVDYWIRNQTSTHVSFFFVYGLPVPRLVEGDRYFSDIVERAAKLICTTPEFDDLAAEVGLGSHANGVTDEGERAQLRAELDGMIAHLYDLTEEEFTHILSTFPIVPEDTKQAALAEYRKLLPSVGDQAIIDLITQGESNQLEFKSTARWDLRENKKSKVMEAVILKTVAAFLNSDGGTLLIGVADDGTVLGLQPGYPTLKQGKQNRDGYELWLMGDLLLNALGNDLAPCLAIGFGRVDGQDLCRVTVQPAPRPVHFEAKNKQGQLEECFYIRAGNQTKPLTKPSEIMHYQASRWP